MYICWQMLLVLMLGVLLVLMLGVGAGWGWERAGEAGSVHTDLPNEPEPLRPPSSTLHPGR